MTKTKLLIGSLSSDLFRVATLKQRGSEKAAECFLQEAKRWANELSTHTDIKPYVMKIISTIQNDADTCSLNRAEDYLMYGVLLQNYTSRLK